MTRNLVTPKTSVSPPSRKAGWYRGVKLQTPAAAPRIPLSRLREAVERAIENNPDALARSK